MSESGRLALLGVGSCLPSRVVGNEEVGALSGIAPDRIRALFEVEQRHWSRGVDTARPVEGERCSDLAAEASRRALDDAGVTIGDIDTIVVVSTSPDVLNPSLDYLVSSKLGLRSVLGFTVHAPCTGVFRALVLAESLVRTGRARTALIVAAETVSPFFRFGDDVPKDHKLNTVLYADGAGALVVSAEDSANPIIESPIVRTRMLDEPPGIVFKGLMSATPPDAATLESGEYLGHHDFRRVLEKGGHLAATAARETLAALGAASQDVRYFLTHQATGHIKRIGASHGIPAEKLPVNIDRVGNTISASIVILLDELKRRRAFRSGDLLILHTAESSSWSYAGAAIRWR